MYAIMIDSHIPMFDSVLYDMNENQKQVLYWCKFYYHNIYSLSDKERPDDFTVNYDILLDEWLNRKEFLQDSNVKSADNMDSVISFD
jgi:hypothetical protein